MGLENFTTYTEVDPNNRYAVTSNKITFTALSRNEDAYVYKDKGVNHFSGDFEHLFDYQITGSSVAVIASINAWTLTNDIDDINGLVTNGKHYLTVQINKAPVVETVYLVERYLGTSYLDSFNVTAGTQYWLKVIRDEAVGSFGTLYCYVYSDSTRTTLVDTLVVVLHAKVDWRYIFAANSFNNGGTDWVSGYVEGMNIQESSAVTFFFFQDE